MIKIIMAIAAIAALSSCTLKTFNPDQNKTNYESELKQRLAEVNITDGINKEEAMTISETYYYRFAGAGCGALGAMEETKTTWDRLVRVGYAGEPIPERIIIDKKTGETTWKFGPKINDIQQIWTTEQANQPDAE